MSDSSSPEAGPSSRPANTNGPSYRPNPSFSFPSAFQPSIIRSYQKDSYYLSLLRSQLHEVTRTLLGSRFLQQHGQAVSLFAALGYHVFTTWEGAQTLGEEYVGSRMIETGGDKAGSFVSKQRRVAFILVQVLAPFILSRVYARMRRRINASNTARQQALQRRVLRWKAVGGQPAEEPKASRMDRLVGRLCKWLPSLETLNRADGWIAYGTALHLMLFYLGGRYYKVAQRVVGVEYISIHPSPPGQEPPSYEVLGVLLGVQLGVKLALALNRHLHRRAAAAAAARKKKLASGDNEDEKDGQQQDDEDEAAPTVDVDGRLWSHKSGPARPVAAGLRAQGLDGGDEHDDDDPSSNPRDYSSLPPPGRTVPLAYPSSTSSSLLPSITSSRSPSNNTISTAQLQAAPLESSSTSMLRCTLCMDERQPHKGTSAVTECGHVFDWSCIMSWLREKGECPLCRQEVKAERVVPIYNM